MLSKFKLAKHQQYLAQLPKFSQSIEDIQTIYSPDAFRLALITAIGKAKCRIYIAALYLENDDGGKDVLTALYQAKQQHPRLDICVLVDWHRAQRGRIGMAETYTNADWYCTMAQQYIGIEVPIMGVPVNTREALGVFHLKGFIIDDQVIYSGASLNNVYLHRHDKYRYDRYVFITNSYLANTMADFIQHTLLAHQAVQRLDRDNRPKTAEIRNTTRQFRHMLHNSRYFLNKQITFDKKKLSLIPLVGLGKQNILNKTIHHLMCSTVHKLTLCTPYFNLPTPLARNIIYLLRQGKAVEIIVADKKANDFFIPENEPFKIIGILPYLYEINLRRFCSRLQNFIDNNQLNVRLWEDQDNSYHLKGMWIDQQWQLMTGNNLNPRAWRLDLENAILIYDPNNEMHQQRQQELNCILTHTHRITHYQELDTLQDYPPKVRKLICRLRRIRIDRLISRIL